MVDPHAPARRGAEGYHRSQDGPSSVAGGRPYPSMKELQDMAAAMNLSEAEDGASLNQLLRIADESIQKSKALSSRGQLDLALVQYLRASEITVNSIPQHPDFSYMKRHHPKWADHFASLIMAVNSQHGIMESIKRRIIADNHMAEARSRPSSQLGTSPAPNQPRHATRPTSYHGSSPGEPPLRMPSPSSFQSSSNSPSTESYQTTSPTTLGNSASQSTQSWPDQSRSAADELAARFAGLRMAQNASASAAHDRNGAGQGHSGVSNPAFLAYNQHPPSYQGNVTPRIDPPASRPLGPRDMAPPQPSAPHVPPKLPLPPSLPRYPSPAYSPARTMPSQPSLNPPRTSTEITRPSRYRATTPNSVLNSSVMENPYRSQTPNGTRVDEASRPLPPHMPVGPTIHAEQLVECIRTANVLLIDVRPREEYDGGHIFAKSIMCIEPVILKEGVSAEELEERLVMSPEAELSLFSRRDEFDLIVYYDQNTREPTYLIGSPAGTSMPHLRALYDTLYEFNMYKPLKGGRQPTLLVGGLEAWIEIFGPQSLATSQTAGVISTIRAGRLPPRPGQPLRRFPTASANSSWEVRKRRLRDYKPLDKDEERVWLEKAKNEAIEPSSYGFEETEEPGDIEQAESEPVSPFVRSYEDFYRRFPDPRDIRESMVIPPSLEAGLPYRPDQGIAIVPSRPPPAVPRRSYGGVTDGRQIQPPLERQISATKQALYTSPIDRLKLPRTGLVNMGATCYMNSIIQSLSATRELTRFFMDNRFHLQVQKNWKGSQGVLPGLYANLIRALWKGDVEVIRPTSFRKFIGRLNQEWADNRQQDAKEFFDVLIDCLHEDLNLNWEKKPLEPLTFDQEMRRERMQVHRVSHIEWDRYRRRELSYISDLFAGQHASRLRCVTCGNTSTTYEAFFSISVEIPSSGTGDLYQCLRSYCQEEMLSDDDVWKCPHCRCEREATKRIILTRAPRFLVIHFKRFSASRKERARKIHTPINFPLTGLDITQFMIQPPPPAPAQPSEQNGAGDAHQQQPSHPPPQSSMNPAQLATSPPYVYNAYAVVRHIGSTMHEGHYISLVRDNARDCWRKFDDQRVTDFRPGSSRADNPANEQAYLVFYERTRVN